MIYYCLLGIVSSKEFCRPSSRPQLETCYKTVISQVETAWKIFESLLRALFIDPHPRVLLLCILELLCKRPPPHSMPATWQGHHVKWSGLPGCFLPLEENLKGGGERESFLIIDSGFIKFFIPRRIYILQIKCELQYKKAMSIQCETYPAPGAPGRPSVSVYSCIILMNDMKFCPY